MNKPDWGHERSLSSVLLFRKKKKQVPKHEVLENQPFVTSQIDSASRGTPPNCLSDRVGTRTGTG